MRRKQENPKKNHLVHPQAEHVLISCELTVFCITDLSLELFSNVQKAGFLIMGLFKVGGGGLYCVPIMYLKTAI